ncbi:MAG: hypothetical protein IKX14_02780 [Neisseriaceae bacterium]|nr:hypothetical protein [Neisseriaceae bacterium]
MWSSVSKTIRFAARQNEKTIAHCSFLIAHCFKGKLTLFMDNQGYPFNTKGR